MGLITRSAMDKPPKRRSSILKRIDNTAGGQLPPSSPTITNIHRRISFHGKKSVKEFSEGTDKATIWHHSYEEEAAHFSNEPLTGTTTIASASALHLTQNQTTKNQPNTALAPSPVGDETTNNSHHMSLTFIDADTAQSRAEHLTLLDDGDDDDPLPDERYDDVGNFNRSLDRLSFDNESLDDDDEAARAPNMNRTNFAAISMGADSHDGDSAHLMSMDTEPTATLMLPPHTAKRPLGDRTRYGESLATDPMEITGAVRKSMLLRHRKSVAMDCSGEERRTESPQTAQHQRTIHFGGQQSAESSMEEVTRFPTVQQIAPANDSNGSDMNCSETLPEPIAPKLRESPLLAVANSSDMDCCQSPMGGSMQMRPAAASNRTVWGGGEMEQTHAVCRQLDHSRTRFSPAPMELSGAEQESPAVEGGDGDGAIDWRQQTGRAGDMEMTHGMAANNFSIYIDESLVMPRDLLSSTKIGGGLFGALAADAEADVSELRAVDAPSPRAAHKQHQQRPQQFRRSVIMRRHSLAQSVAKVESIAEASCATVDASASVSAASVDRQRFDRTLGLALADDAAPLDDIEPPATSSSLGSCASVADASSSMGLFRSGNTELHDEVRGATSKQGEALLEPLAPISTAGSLHFSRYNNLAELTMFDRCSEEELDGSSVRSGGRRTISPATIGQEQQVEVVQLAQKQRCSLGTPAETEESLCRKCAGCRQRLSSARSSRSSRSSRSRSPLRKKSVAAVAPLSPLGPMDDLLQRPTADAAAEDGETGGDRKPLHVDYSGYEQLAQYAAPHEVIASWHQRSEELRRKLEEESLLISQNVPAPDELALLNNLWDAEFEEKERQRQLLEAAIVPRPLFPRGRTIHWLLRNVFDTCESLGWRYTDWFFHGGRISLWHTRLPSLILRLHFDPSASSTDDLRFKRIVFVDCPKSAKYMCPRMWIRHNELRASLPFELTSLCPTSVQLLPFLQRLEAQHFRPACETARRIGQLAAANDALVLRENDGTCFVERQLFVDGLPRQTITIKLTVVAQTTLQHVFLKPVRPVRASATEVAAFGTGLQLIERLLVDPWTYIRRDVQPDTGEPSAEADCNKD